MFEIVPGVSMDCKANANRFGMSLFTINGRTNSAHITTYFMAILPNETEEILVKVLSHFSEVISVSPAIISIDQNAACIAAIKPVFPLSFISLDAWHFNKNQLENVQQRCNKIKEKS